MSTPLQLTPEQQRMVATVNQELDRRRRSDRTIARSRRGNLKRRAADPAVKQSIQPFQDRSIVVAKAHVD